MSKKGYSWTPYNHEIPKSCYFIEFDLKDKDTKNEIMFYFNRYRNFDSNFEIFRYTKPFKNDSMFGFNFNSLKDIREWLNNNDKIILEYPFLHKWLEAIHHFENELKIKASFKIYCNDELSCDEDRIIVGYA